MKPLSYRRTHGLTVFQWGRYSYVKGKKKLQKSLKEKLEKFDFIRLKTLM